MAEIHSPDIYGPLAAAGAPGSIGQVLTSAGPGAQVGWQTPNPDSFSFVSPSALVHTITHNLGVQFPTATVYSTPGNAIIVPASVVATSINVTTITFFAARAIAGTIDK